MQGSPSSVNLRPFPSLHLGVQLLVPRWHFPSLYWGGSNFGEPAALSKPSFGGTAFGAPVAFSKPPLGGSNFGEPVALSKPSFGGTAFGAPVALSKPPLGGSNFGEPAAFSKPSFGSTAFGAPVAFSKPPLGGSNFGEPAAFSKPHESSPKSTSNDTAHVVKLPRERLRPDHHESFERATPYLRILYEEFVQNPKVTLQRTFSKERKRSAAATAAIKELDRISGGMQSRELQESHAGGETGPFCIEWEKFGELWHLAFDPPLQSDRQEVEKEVEEKLLNHVERFVYPYGWAKLPPHYP
ncbi:hypothetical protein N7524_000211 [Penicillium chrysogenum]|nr:hypothetical protein N7524_000211 [Penicillium chrysogenum]